MEYITDFSDWFSQIELSDFEDVYSLYLSVRFNEPYGIFKAKKVENEVYVSCDYVDAVLKLSNDDARKSFILYIQKHYCHNEDIETWYSFNKALEKDDEDFKLDFADYKESSIRNEEEDNDQEEDAVSPPIDIVAFTEQRSCADLLRMIKHSQINLHPDYQRGEVWSPRAQSLFIDSLLKQLPIPSMCFSYDAKTNKREVIDGLQRVTSIVKFLDTDTVWKISNTKEVDERLRNKTNLEIMEYDSEIFGMIENIMIPVTVLRCDTSKKSHMEYLYQIFKRLNTGGSKLYNQEIRNCIYQGSFNNLLKDLATSPEWMHFVRADEVEKIKKARMIHEERILRFFAFFYNSDSYKSSFAGFLNEFMAMNRDAEEGIINNYRRLFEETMSIANKIKKPSDSKNVIDAVLVGIARNLDTLKDLDEDRINRLYGQIMEKEEFSKESLRSALSSNANVSKRIEIAIDVFRNGNH